MSVPFVCTPRARGEAWGVFAWWWLGRCGWKDSIARTKVSFHVLPDSTSLCSSASIVGRNVERFLCVIMVPPGGAGAVRGESTHARGAGPGFGVERHLACDIRRSE